MNEELDLGRVDWPGKSVRSATIGPIEALLLSLQLRCGIEGKERATVTSFDDEGR